MFPLHEARAANWSDGLHLRNMPDRHPLSLRLRDATAATPADAAATVRAYLARTPWLESRKATQLRNCADTLAPAPAGFVPPDEAPLNEPPHQPQDEAPTPMATPSSKKKKKSKAAEVPAEPEPTPTPGLELSVGSTEASTKAKKSSRLRKRDRT
jgi:hypothetical protein